MSNKNRAQRSGALALNKSPMYAMYYEPLLNPRVEARSRTAQIEWVLQRKIMELSMNRFKWEGLPDEVSKRNLEQALMYNCLAILHKEERFDKYMIQYGAPAGNLNMQNDPTEYIAYGNGVYPTTRYNIEECVPIWGNYMRMPDIDMIRIYSSRLAELDRTIEINSKNARMNKIIIANENTRLSAKAINEQIEAGSNMISVEADFGNIEDMFSAFDLGINPASFEGLSVLRGKVWNELMTMLGLNNANQDKKERLVAAEVSGNDDMVEAFRATNLQARQAGCDLMNERYGLTVTVDYVTDMNQTAMKDTGSGDAQNRELGQK